MHRFWNIVIEPVLERLQPEVIVEVGSEDGKNTINLLEFCKKNNAVLHAIDPVPKFDRKSLEEEYEGHFVFHQSLSLNALPKISQFDAVLIDGDHNWYTVFNELNLIKKNCHKNHRHFPIVFLHDIGWPYGRRDLYYQPDNIPDAYRKPYKKMGMLPSSPGLLDEDGLNAHLFNSIYENDLQDGVLTAIEDFLDESGKTFDFLKLPGINGLGVIIDERLKKENGDLREFLENLNLSSFERNCFEILESHRIDLLIAVSRKKKKIKELEELISIQSAENRKKIETMKAQIETMKAQIETMKAQIETRTADLDRLQKLVLERDLDIGMLVQWMDQVQSDFTALLASHRWRWGNMLGEMFRRVRFKTRVPMVTNHLNKTFQKFGQWKDKSHGLEHGRTVIKSLINQLEHPSIETDVSKIKNPSPAGESAGLLRSPRGDIIVCIHNSPEDVRNCLDSLVRHTNLYRHHLILVDDGSDEETARIVVRYVSRFACTYIRNEEALAYTRAANQGLTVSSGGFVVLLNSDTIVTSGWLDQMIDCAFSSPDIACVGPLSNAASWQSIPEITDKNGGWCVNYLPEGVKLADYAQAITTHSRCLYPDVPFINGFCYLITRQALDKVGLLDEVNFPQGYGEEDDFSMRALVAGFKNKIADNCYVYHAKSKSYTPERRKLIVQKSSETIKKKHGPKRMKSILKSMSTDENLLRSRVTARLAVKTIAEKPTERDFAASPITIGWLQPHLETVGGIRRVIEMTNRLMAWGNSVFIITPDGRKTTWMPIAADVVPFSDMDALRFDVLIVSDPDVIEPFGKSDARLKINYHLAPYMLYRKADKQLDAYYRADEDILHIANSHWTVEKVQAFSDIQIEKVIPGGIDPYLFYPLNTETLYDVVCYGSKRKHKGTDDIIEAARGLKFFSLANAGLRQNEIARHICSGKVFVSACLHEGFNFCPLEAMACGIPVVMRDDGGSREYAVDGENALVVSPGDKKGLFKAIRRLMEDMPLRLKLIENGMETAWRYSWDSMSADLVDLISEHLGKGGRDQ